MYFAVNRFLNDIGISFIVTLRFRRHSHNFRGSVLQPQVHSIQMQATRRCTVQVVAQDWAAVAAEQENCSPLEIMDHVRGRRFYHWALRESCRRSLVVHYTLMIQSKHKSAKSLTLLFEVRL